MMPTTPPQAAPAASISGWAACLPPAGSSSLVGIYECRWAAPTDEVQRGDKITQGMFRLMAINSGPADSVWWWVMGQVNLDDAVAERIQMLWGSGPMTDSHHVISTWHELQEAFAGGLISEDDARAIKNLFWIEPPWVPTDPPPMFGEPDANDPTQIWSHCDALTGGSPERGCQPRPATPCNAGTETGRGLEGARRPGCEEPLSG